ncbi:MAG TPA: glucan 1,4-alpha-glucosidase [Gemmatimonadales bacterium]|nr:glucan 1,4-alpha-glucosidase [Gemmatimonadales bacterium]
MPDPVRFAPGWPGIPARWTSSAKSGIGTALSEASRVWFTLSHGILNEIYYPDVDTACTRDVGLVVTDGRGFFSEEKRHTIHEVSWIEPGVPAFRLRNTCDSGRYRIEKTVLASPESNAILQHLRFLPERGALADYHVHVLASPHLGNQGAGNTGWLGEYKGAPMLFASRNDHALALAASVPWARRSVGFVGSSDGWQDLVAHGRLEAGWTRAENGNVALTGELDLSASGGECLLAIGFGRDPSKAAHHALAALLPGFEASLEHYARGWSAWQRSLRPLDAWGNGSRQLRRVSSAVLLAHQSKSFLGGTIASLSIPWGFAKGDGDLGGYHLVWPRDLVEAAGALLAVGAPAEARQVLRYLQSTQEADGHWAQNQWLDGTPYWSGVQMDETAFPILLVDLARREGALAAEDVARLWPMARRAAGYLVRNGPVTLQDRWEEDAGYSPFTLAVEISALLAAADLAQCSGEPAVAGYLRETADVWNAGVERWTWAADTPLARRLGVAGYYIRIAPPESADAASPAHGFVPIKNRPPDQAVAKAEEVVSPDALALVRFGLRRADDPRILDTVRVIDALLKVELPGGPAWRRYTGDGYGEHEDGSPFDGTGVGRPWPLLVGERAHYELASGRPEKARALLATLERFASPGGLLPEQVWDGPDLPDRELFTGRPSGAAMPLVWAHAEYLKLVRSLEDGRVFDTPPQAEARYARGIAEPAFHLWRFNQKCRSMPGGLTLRLEVLAPARVRWTADGWVTFEDAPTRDTGLGVHVADLPTTRLGAGGEVAFTFLWTEGMRWEGTNFSVRIPER